MTTTWNINKLICKTSEGSLNNIVYMILWECKRSDSNGINVFEEGMVEVPQANPDNFIPYNNLTKNEVVSWVKAELGQAKVNMIESRLEQRLTDKLNSVTLDPPFAN